MCIDQVAELSKALLTPIIAIVATYIAWQQWKTNRQKLNLERYDRRLHVYEEVKKILSIISANDGADWKELVKFRTAASEADFLFGAEIPEYIDEIYKHGLKHKSWKSQYRDYTQPRGENYNHQKVVKGMNDEFEWLIGQFDTAKEKFRNYLDISK